MRARATFCNHYRAMSDHETCKAGVSYASLQGIPFDKRPCFRKDRHEAVRTGCDLVQFPTEKEIDESEEWMNQRFENMSKARTAIVESLGGPWKKGMSGAVGKIKCPVCETGTLSFSRAGYNGHIHAGCSTDSCVRWME